MSISLKAVLKKYRYAQWLPFGIIALALTMSILLTIFTPGPRQQHAPNHTLLVDALIVEKQDVLITVPSQGRVTPHMRTMLTSEVSGSVIEVSPHFVNGGFVEKGQLLLKLDDRNYLAAVKKAEADIARFNREFIQEKGQAQVAYNQWKQSKQLKRTPEALSLLLREPQLKETEANLTFARAELERARADLEKTQIHAPYDGLIKKKLVDFGQYVTPGTNFAEMVAVDYAEVRLAIPQDRLAYLELPGITRTNHVLNKYQDNTVISPENTTDTRSDDRKKIPVTLKSHYGNVEHQWQARLARTEGLFDENNHTLYVVARIDDPYQLRSTATLKNAPLLLGTYVEAFIEGKLMQDVIIIPRHVLRAGNNIWVIDENDQLRSRELSTLRVGGDQVYVTDGLQDGEKICLTHVGEVVPGTTVRIAGNKPAVHNKTAMRHE